MRLEDTQLTFSHFSCVIHQQAKKGNRRCGDSFLVREFSDHFIVAIADGLGSGEAAYQCSKRATQLIVDHHVRSPADMVNTINRKLAGSRGVVLAVAKFFPNKGRVVFCGIGNISFTLYSERHKRIRAFSLPGYMDGRQIKPREEIFRYRTGDFFAMYSDGITPHQDWSTILNDVESPVEGLTRIKQIWETENDDLTFILGR